MDLSFLGRDWAWAGWLGSTEVSFAAPAGSSLTGGLLERPGLLAPSSAPCPPALLLPSFPLNSVRAMVEPPEAVEMSTTC